MPTRSRELRLAPKPPARSTRDPQALSHDLALAFGGLARRLRTSVPDLTTSEVNFLEDAAKALKGETRQPHTALARFLAIAPRSVFPHHREAPAEVVRSVALLGSLAPIALDETFDREDDANSLADKAVRRFQAERTEPNRRAAIVALEAQLAATRDALDACYAARCNDEGGAPGRATPLNYVAPETYTRGDLGATARLRMGLDPKVTA